MRNFDYSKLIHKSWDTDIVRLIAQIHEFKGRETLFLQQKSESLARLIDNAKIQSVEFSNKIEGIITTSLRMKQLFNDKTTPKNRDEQEIMGYRDVLNTIHENYSYIALRPSYILQLHRDMLQKANISCAGQFKNVQNYINEIQADGKNVTRFTPLPPYETPQAIENLCFTYQQAVAQDKIDALILIPIFICDFLCIHPFNDGNGRMSRLLTLLLLYQQGYNVGKYISIEKQIEKTKDEYYRALYLSDRDWYEEKNDPTSFIRYMLQVILSCYSELAKQMDNIEISVGKKLNAYQIVRQYTLNKIGKFTTKDILTACPNIGRSSIIAALNKLAEEKIIIKQGLGKNTFYIRNNDL